MKLLKYLQERIFGTTVPTSSNSKEKTTRPWSLYNRLALITSITLVTGYVLVHAAYSVINSTEYQTGAPLTAALFGKVVDNITDLNGRFGTLTNTKWCTSNGTQIICNSDAPSGGGWGGSLWSTGASSSINYTAWVVWIWSPSGNAELQIKSGTKPHWGIYQSESTEELNFWNVENRMTLAKNGNVGIGVTNPAWPLEVGVTTTPGRSGIGVNATTENAYLTLGRNGDNATMVLKNDGTLRFNHSGSSWDAHLVIGTGGNVGIGTASPGAKLDVNGNSVIGRVQSNLWTSFAMIYNEDNTSSLGLQKRWTTASGNINLPPWSSEIFSANSPFGIYTTGNNYLSFGTNYAEKVRIDPNGNVGIGTTDPKSKLQVVGLPEYAGNAAAVTAGLTVGAFYRTWEFLKVVY